MRDTISVDPDALRADPRRRGVCDRMQPVHRFGGGLPIDDWAAVIEAAGFTDLSIGHPVDAFGGSAGEHNARAHDVSAHVFLAPRPGRPTS